MADSSRPQRDLPHATHAGEREVAGISIPVYNLSNGERVLSERGFLSMIGAKGRGATGGHRIARILQDSVLKHFFSHDLLMAIENPIRFYNRTNVETNGYPAEILQEFCQAFAQAHDAGACKTEAQVRYASNCKQLVYAFGKLGVEAWIDEATGYQYERNRDALHRILEKYMAPIWAEWSKTFPDEYYEQIFRLRGWPYDPSNLSRPSYLGKITNDIVYARLAPGVLEALREKNPVIDEEGNRKRKHHQWLTRDYGHPKLQQHISNVVFLMKGYETWDAFYRRLQHIAPKLYETPELDLDEY
jgi:hypothetical protein